MELTRTRPLVVSLGHWLVTKIGDREEDFYRADPVGYERIVGDLDGRRSVADCYADTVREHFRDEGPRLIVDLACGTGLICEALSRVGERVVGVDLSNGMLAHAKKKNLANVEFAHGDFHDLRDIESDSADVVTQYAASRYVHDADQYHHEIARILSPRGIAILSYYEAPGRLDEMRTAARRAGLRTAREMPIPRPARFFAPALLGYRDKSIWVYERV